MEFTFTIKKLLGTLLMPLPFCLLLMILGLLLLWFSHQRSGKQMLGKVLVSLGVSILTIASLPISSQRLNIALERDYPPLYEAPQGLEYVIVLGGGHLNDPYLPAHQQLHTAGYYRITEGLRLMRANPGATLLLSGYGGSNPTSNAQVYSQVAQQYGIPVGQIRLFETARDTAEEAAQIVPVIGQRKSALVTSASHMPRVLSLFHALGAEPIPAPTRFIGKVPIKKRFFYQQLPEAGSLSAITVAWHEIVGSAWRGIRKF